MTETVLLDVPEVAAAFDRLADSVRARNDGLPLMLVGIHTRGVVVARRLAAVLGAAPPGSLDISLYRDDLDHRGSLPQLRSTDLPAAVEGSRIVLCDDVLYTGRTIRAALEGIAALGRPARVELAVLVDRGGRELPIQADHTGWRSEIANGRVMVRLEEQDGRDAVVLIE